MSKRQLSVHRPTLIPLSGHDRLSRKKAPKPTPENPLIISASELRTFLRCRLKWWWRHQVRIETIEKPTALKFGGVTHEILDKWYALPEKSRTSKRMKNVAEKVLTSTDPQYLSIEDLELIGAMAIGYSAWARPRDKELKLRNVLTEQFFELPLVEDGSIRVRGFIDAEFEIGQYRRTMGCFEHKTASQIRSGNVDTNLQLSVYLWALRWKYPNYRRYIAFRNTLRKQMPTPRVRAPLFARETVERTDDEIDQWAEDISRIARDMLDAAIYPNPMDACSWDCDYQVPCLLRGRDDDLEHVISTNYKRKESDGRQAPTGKEED